MDTLFGKLPVEIIYHIFDYLSLTDIIRAFSNINSQLNKAFRTHNSYYANLQSCPKRYFHQICLHIPAENIISLTLSNDNDTPDQFQLFFSTFTIGQFTRLRSITLINIKNNLLLNFINTLNFRQLESLTIRPGTCSPRELPNDALSHLPPNQLKRLVVYNASCINMQLVYRLEYLTLQSCNGNELRQILTSMPVLKFLKITNHTGNIWFNIHPVPLQLKSLVLNSDVRVSMVDMEVFLVQLINLKNLELQLKGNLQDLCNGERWSPLVRNLMTFDFVFRSENELITSPQVLINSLYAVFWLHGNKQWFVAYSKHPSRVFTVPRFAATSAQYETLSSFKTFHVPEYSTVPNISLFQDRISSLMISSAINESELTHRFMHIETLTIASLGLLGGLNFIVDVSQIQCLKITANLFIGQLERFIPMILPRVHELHLPNLPRGDHQRMHGIHQIRTLYIQTVDNSVRLCHQFPCLERLHIGHIESYQNFRFILTHLRSYLSFVSLIWPTDNQPQQPNEQIQTLLERDREELNFNYRCLEQRRFTTVYLWISGDSHETVPSVPPRRRNRRLLKYFKWLSLFLQWFI